MKRVILTGGTGFVGANLARRLLAEEVDLHLIVRPGYKSWRIREIASQVEFHEVDLKDKQRLNVLIEKIHPEWIFHLAAYGAYSFQTDFQEMIQTNFGGTINLVEACLKTGFDAFVNTGSSSEYGFKDNPPTEMERLEPNSHYAVTKASSTLYCRHIAQANKIHMPTLRLYSVYGPYEEPSRLIPTIIRAGMEGRFPPLTSPLTVHDFVYIDDVVEAYLLAASRQRQEYGAIYNVGIGTQTSLSQVAAVAKRTFQIPSEPEWGGMPDRSWDTSYWVSDNRKIRCDLGWAPQVNFDSGFALVADWYRKNSELLKPTVG